MLKTILYYILGFLPIYLAFWLNGEEVKWWQAILIMIGGLIFGLSWPILEKEKYQLNFNEKHF